MNKICKQLNGQTPVRHCYLVLKQEWLRILDYRVAGVQPGLETAQDGIYICVTLLHQ